MCELVEVFSATYKDEDGGDPSGNISVFDGKRGQIIYRSRGRPNHRAQNETNQQLLLTGPYRAISAEGCVAIVIDLHHGCQERPSSYVAEILIDIYDKSTEYDVAITKTVNTCACHRSPTADVTYAILSDAVEATVEVNFQRNDDLADCFSVHTVIACNDVGRVVLFQSNNENTCIEPLLDRSVIAVPFTSFLRIEVCVQSNGQIFESFQECQPDLDSKHKLYISCQIGVVKVTITCSD